MLLYIDPGTGSMLFTIILGVVTTLFFSLKGLVIKIKNGYFSSALKKNANDDATVIPYVIYTDSKRYNNVFGPMCDEFERRGVNLVYMTQDKDDPILSRTYKHVKGSYIGEGNRAFASLNLLKADTCISTTPSLDVYQWKRSKNVRRYVHVFHDLSDATGYEMFGIDYYDEILLTGDVQKENIRELEKLRKLPSKKLVPTGSIYLDEMYKRASKYSEDKKEKKDIPTILLAPSWGHNSILNMCGEKVLNALLKTGYNIVVRPHPQTAVSDPDLLKTLMEKFPDGKNFSWNFDVDNYKVLSNSDMMITDFSEIKCDYALIFNRPFIYLDTKFDLSTYDSAWFDKPTYRFEMLSLMGKRIEEADLDNLKSIVDETIGNDNYAAGREQVKNKIWLYPGEALTRTMDYLVGGDKA